MYLIVDTGILLGTICTENLDSRAYIFPLFKVQVRKRISSLENVLSLSFFVFHDFLDIPKTSEFKLSNYPGTLKYYRKRGNYIFLSEFYHLGEIGLKNDLLKLSDRRLIESFGAKYFERLVGEEKLLTLKK